MNRIPTRTLQWRVVTVFQLLIGLLLSLSALGQTNYKPGFYLIKGSFNWSEANADAVQRGGHLATITSQSEQNAVAALVNGQSGDHFLLGASDSLVEGEWKWVTGEPFLYKNWGAGEPNNQLNEDELFILNRSGNTWIDGNSAARTSGGYVLEIETEPYQPAFLKDGLVAYYPFNGNANDESGLENSGSPTKPILVQDRFGARNSAYSFNGSDQISVNKLSGVSAGKKISVSLWFTVRSPFEWESLISLGSYADPNGWGLLVSNNRLYLRSGDYPNTKTGYGVFGSNVFSPGVWYNCAFVVNENSASLFLNGVLLARQTITADRVSLNSSNELLIGKSGPYAQFPYFLNGTVDDVRIYNRDLSESEVKGLYTYESTPQISTPYFANQPQNQIVTSANDATFCVTLKDSGSYNYQWQRNEQNIAGATLNCYTITSVTAAMDGSRYRVIVSNSAGTIISDNATLTVVTPPPPTIATQPTPKTVQEGANVTLSVVASGQGTFVYQWQFNEQNLPGATSATLNLNAVKLNTAGRYRVLVSSQYGVTISDTVTLTVNPNPPPTIVTQPISRTPAEGTQVSLTVTATGFGTLTYQWQVNGQNIPGATSSTLVLSAVRPSVNGAYRVIVGNTYGTTISTEATIVVVVTDSDSDGLSDYEELLLGTNPNKVDSDGDGLSDFAEVRTHKSNPLTTDTDGDGYSDGIEVARDGNPNNRSVTPTGALAVFPAVDVEFYTLNGVKYQLEVSNDMATWTPQGGVVVGTGGNQNHLIRASKATQFWRLKVVQ